MKEIPFFRPSVGKEEQELIVKALKNSNINYKEELEEEFCKYIGVDYALALSNVSNAFHLVMSAIDLKRGDKFIVSNNAFVDIPEAIRHFDAEPIFADIDTDTFSIDINSIKKILKDNQSKKLRGIIITHIAGKANNLEEFYELARLNDLILIEDASGALGSRYKNKRVGSLNADITIFGFNPTHNKQLLSDAGVMVTNDVEIYENAKLLRNHALETEFDDYGNIDYKYDVKKIGHKFNLNQIDSAFALAQLHKNDSFTKRRTQIASMYNDAFENLQHIIVPTLSSDCTYTQYIIKVDKNRDAFSRELYDFGIATRINFVPLYLLSYYKQKYKFKVSAFLNTLQVYQQILSLPIYADMSDDEVQYIIKSVQKIAKTWV
jgi:dTDP-4-amino-4,6-dideoxygalactose transaminase